MSDEKKLLDDLKTTFEQFKQKMDEHDQEKKQLGDATAETKETADRLQTRLDELETKLNRPGVMKEDGDGVEAEAVKALVKWARKGSISPEESKVLARTDDTTGGVLAPPEYVMEIIKGETEFSPIREVARIRQTSRQSVQMPKRTGQFSARWTHEVNDRTETEGLKWGLEEIPTHEMYAMVDISNWDLEDTVFDLESELRMEFAEQFGVAEGAAFVNGDAVGRPEGLLTNDDVGEVNSGSSSALTADGLINMFFEPKTAYARNGAWALNRKSIRDIRKLKDQQDQYLWQPGLAGVAPATILDRPYIEVPDMPDVAANAFPIIFGDIRRAYTIVDRLEVSILRDPYTQATNGAVRFLARRRVGGQVVLPEAIRKMKVAN